jgi:hypothetical protein
MTKTSLLLTLLLLVQFVLQGQEEAPLKWTYIQVDSTKQMWGDWDDPDWLRYFGLASGDVNRDGNLDIISGRYVYHNPGGAMEGAWKRTVLDDNVDGILVLDVDGDSHVDILAMALPNLYWYEAINAEGTVYNRTCIGQVPATSHVNSQGFEKSQIVAGGPMEFVIAGNGNIYAIQIPETNPEGVPWKVQKICENTSDEGIGVGDIDGDGDLDIAAGRRPPGEEEPTILVWFENPGDIDDSWKGTEVGLSKHPIDRVEISDLNGDERADIIVTEERYPGLEPDANLWWFAQTKTNQWERKKIAEQFSSNNLDIADIDNDGDIDFLTAEHKGKALELQLWINDGNGSFAKTILDRGKENHLGTQFTDLDNDGDLDIIGSGWDRHEYVHVWRNDQIKSLEVGLFFKDYSWVPDKVSDQGKFLRVGGKLDYSVNPNHLSSEEHSNGFIPMNQEVILENSVSAEVIVERVQSHEDTKNLSIQFNSGSSIPVPEPQIIPHPASNYMFHSNITVPVPLQDLKEGDANAFKLTVDEDQTWDWPQNLIYGVVLRVYYKDMGEYDRFENHSEITARQGLNEEIKFSLSSDDLSDVSRVDYMGLYEDVNVQGDGKYLQWQFRYHRGRVMNHIGTSFKPPFEVTWNTDWIPDQTLPILVVAWITDKNGFTQIHPGPEPAELNRAYQVDLLKPFGQPQFWTTRGKEHSQYLDLPYDVNDIDKVKMYWNSWSPCYSVGIEINDVRQAQDSLAPCYDAHWHAEDLQQTNSLKMGLNELKTLKTPLHEGKMVHGMDVQWPGVMLKLKRQNTDTNKTLIYEADYENRPHYVIRTEAATYYYDISGGGFSRVIDKDGNDWINFKSEPWNQYPASAASAYRGLPNMIYGSETNSGAGHPGHDKCVTEIISETQIRTSTIDNSWTWEWTFYEDFAVLEIVKWEKDSPYWFLYEGVPGGRFEPNSSYYGTNMGGPLTDAPDFFNGSVRYGDFQWAYFGKHNLKRSLFIAQVDPDQHVDMMSYLGNSNEGVESKDGMTVFGFGRNEKGVPLLKGDNIFLIGMWDQEITSKERHDDLANHIDKLINKQRNEKN